MEGNPHEAASGIFNARQLLYEAMMTLMDGDLPVALGRLREAEGSVRIARRELEALARVNGVEGDLDALEEAGEGSRPMEPFGPGEAWLVSTEHPRGVLIRIDEEHTRYPWSAHCLEEKEQTTE